MNRHVFIYMMSYFPIENIYSLSLINCLYNDRCKIYHRRVNMYLFRRKLKTNLAKKKESNTEYIEYHNLNLTHVLRYCQPCWKSKEPISPIYGKKNVHDHSDHEQCFIFQYKRKKIIKYILM